MSTNRSNLIASTAVGPTTGRWFARAMIGATLLAAAIAVSPNLADPDLWGHVQYGRDLIDEGLARTTSYSYTADGHPWINHENLSEVIMAWAAYYGGPALMIGKCLLGLLVVGLMMRAAKRNQAGLIVACVSVLLVAANLSYHWSIRPQIASYVCFALMLWLLDHCFRGWAGQGRLDRTGPPEATVDRSRLRRLWAAVPLFVVWGNAHGGFVAGLVIFTAYLILRSIEAWRQFPERAYGLTLRFALMAGAAGVATLLNPYGPRLHLWLLSSLGQSRPEINEWHAPQFFDSLSIPLWLLLFAFVSSLLFTKRRHDFTHLTLLAVTLWQSLEHQRHVPFFAIAFGFWMPVHMQSWLERCGLSKDESESTHEEDQPPLAVRVAFGFAMVAVFGLLSHRLYERLRVVRVERADYPVGAIQYMSDEQIEGNLAVTFNWAQYVIGVFGAPESKPHIPVAFDGRFRTCYPQELVDAHFDFILGDLQPRPGSARPVRSRGGDSPPFSPDRFLQFAKFPRGSAQLVLINRFQPHAGLVMLRRHDQWVLLYQDATAQLWGLRSRFDNPESRRFVPPERRSISDTPQIGHVAWPALPADAEGKAAIRSESNRPANGRQRT